MASNKYRRICKKVDVASAALDRANKNAERVMLDALLNLNRRLLNQKD